MSKKKPTRRVAEKAYADYRWEDGPPPAWLARHDEALQATVFRPKDPDARPQPDPGR